MWPISQPDGRWTVRFFGCLAEVCAHVPTIQSSLADAVSISRLCHTGGNPHTHFPSAGRPNTRRPMKKLTNSSSSKRMSCSRRSVVQRLHPTTQALAVRQSLDGHHRPWPARDFPPFSNPPPQHLASVRTRLNLDGCRSIAMLTAASQCWDGCGRCYRPLGWLARVALRLPPLLSLCVRRHVRLFPSGLR